MSVLSSSIAPALPTQADRPLGGRLLRACCAAVVMVLALPCATTAAEFVLAQPAAAEGK